MAKFADKDQQEKHNISLWKSDNLTVRNELYTYWKNFTGQTGFIQYNRKDINKYEPTSMGVAMNFHVNLLMKTFSTIWTGKWFEVGMSAHMRM